VVPLPDPLVPDVILIQDEFEVAVQLQPAAAVTDTEAVPPEAPKLCDVGETWRLHDPLSVIVTVLPAIVIVPVRGDVPLLAVTR
jgi:hypothetical protein